MAALSRKQGQGRGCLRHAATPRNAGGGWHGARQGAPLPFPPSLVQQRQLDGKVVALHVGRVGVCGLLRKHAAKLQLVRLVLRHRLKHHVGQGHAHAHQRVALQGRAGRVEVGAGGGGAAVPGGQSTRMRAPLRYSPCAALTRSALNLQGSGNCFDALPGPTGSPPLPPLPPHPPRRAGSWTGPASAAGTSPPPPP